MNLFAGVFEQDVDLVSLFGDWGELPALRWPFASWVCTGGNRIFAGL